MNEGFIRIAALLGDPGHEILFFFVMNKLPVFGSAAPLLVNLVFNEGAEILSFEADRKAFIPAEGDSLTSLDFLTPYYCAKLVRCDLAATADKPRDSVHEGLYDWLCSTLPENAPEDNFSLDFYDEASREAYLELVQELVFNTSWTVWMRSIDLHEGRTVISLWVEKDDI